MIGGMEILGKWRDWGYKDIRGNGQTVGHGEIREHSGKIAKERWLLMGRLGDG